MKLLIRAFQRPLLLFCAFERTLTRTLKRPVLFITGTAGALEVTRLIKKKDRKEKPN
jgi:hypothetical protein